MLIHNFFSQYTESVYVYDANTGMVVAELIQHSNDANEIMYVLKMNWENYAILGDTVDDIPGYDMSLKLDEYVRYNSTVFMTEYLPPSGREDVLELMHSVGLDMGYDMWAYMIEQGRKCMDNWRVCKIPGHTYAHEAYKIK